MKNLIVYKRFFAYLIDIVLALFITWLLMQIPGINPYSEDNKKVYEEYEQVVKQYNVDKTITIEEFQEKLIPLNAKAAKYGCIYDIIEIVVLFLYFVVFQWFFKGQTIGKRLFKLKVVNKNEKEALFWNYIVRLLFINGFATMLITIICLFILNPTGYYYSYSLMQIFEGAILISIILTVYIRCDHRGLHDLVAQTMVIDARNFACDNLEVETIKRKPIKGKKIVEKKKA